MLKRRIFAASLASVLALSSFSVAAFADDEIKSQTVTKAELQKYVDSFEKFREDDIFEYGTVQGEYFQDAIDYAENVLANNKATAEDFTAAYQMLKAVRDGMRQYNKDELAGKLDEYKGIYDSNNILNEDLNDNIYKPDTYADFYDAYEVAQGYVNSDDGRLISDAYIELETAKKNLKELETVTKADFRAVLKQYEAIIADETSYESWRRGTCSVAPTTGDKKDAKGDKILSKVTKAKYITFGDLLEIVKGESQIAIPDDKGKAEAVQSATATKTWIKVVGSGTVEKGVTDQYARFDEIKSSKVTSDEDIVNAYKAAKDAVAVFNGWTEDNTKRAAKADVEKLLRTYHNDLIAEVKLADALELINEIDADAVYDEDKKVVKATKAITLKVDEDGFIDNTGDKEKKVSKNQDLLQYVPVNADEVEALIPTADDISAAETAVTDAEGEVTTAESSWNGKKTATETAKGEMDTAQDAFDKNASDIEDKLGALASAQDNVKSALESLEDAISKFETEWNKVSSEVATEKTTEKTAVENAMKDESESGSLANLIKAIEDDTTLEGGPAKTTVEALESAISTFKSNVTELAKDSSSTFTSLTFDGEFADLSSAIDTANTELETERGKTAGLQTTLEGAQSTYESAQSDEESAKEALDEAKDTLSKAETKLAKLKAAAAADSPVSMLATAMDIAEEYLNAKDIDKTTGDTTLAAKIDAIDENDTVSKATGSVTEWTLVKRYLQYALEDLFPKNDSKTYTKNDVRNLIEKAYDLAEKTGDASKFQENHVALVEARKAAIEWLSEANKTKNYKEGDAVSYEAEYGVEVAGTEVSLTATETYKALEGKYNNLDKELQDYAISYGEIRNLIVEVAEYLDKNDSEALKTAMTDVAYKLSTLDADGEDSDDNEVFDDSREFQEFNRLHTDNKNSDKPTDAEKDLKTAYNDLKSAYESLTSPTTTKGDVPST